MRIVFLTKRVRLFISRKLHKRITKQHSKPIVLWSDYCIPAISLSTPLMKRQLETSGQFRKWIFNFSLVGRISHCVLSKLY